MGLNGFSILAISVSWAAPEMGRGAWENWTEIDTGRSDRIAMIGGDDTESAPLYLYIGEKNGVGDGSFLDRNGLKQGKLYVWVGDEGVDPRTLLVLATPAPDVG
ncbi:MAG UNVERIFIED_CONTAM: hypothetical protein LVR29_26645 [Microcystis novacekii LVE1205-3]